MFSQPQNPEVAHRTIRLIIGLIALFLAGLTNFLAGGELESISAAYHANDWSRNIFVGALFALAALLACHNGYSRTEMILSKIAAVGALGVALFPCECNIGGDIVPYVHYLSAGIMFAILTFMCYAFYRRARSKSTGRANLRAIIYAACGLVIIASIVIMAYYSFTRESTDIKQVIFYGERAGLIAFGISWLLASHILPGVSTSNERHTPFR